MIKTVDNETPNAYPSLGCEMRSTSYHLTLDAKSEEVFLISCLWNEPGDLLNVTNYNLPGRCSILEQTQYNQDWSMGLIQETI